MLLGVEDMSNPFVQAHFLEEPSGDPLFTVGTRVQVGLCCTRRIFFQRRTESLRKLRTSLMMNLVQSAWRSAGLVFGPESL